MPLAGHGGKGVCTPSVCTVRLWDHEGTCDMPRSTMPRMVRRTVTGFRKVLRLYVAISLRAWACAVHGQTARVLYLLPVRTAVAILAVVRSYICAGWRGRGPRARTIPSTSGYCSPFRLIVANCRPLLGCISIVHTGYGFQSSLPEVWNAASLRLHYRHAWLQCARAELEVDAGAWCVERRRGSRILSSARAGRGHPVSLRHTFSLAFELVQRLVDELDPHRATALFLRQPKLIHVMGERHRPPLSASRAGSGLVAVARGLRNAR